MPWLALSWNSSLISLEGGPLISHSYNTIWVNYWTRAHVSSFKLMTNMNRSLKGIHEWHPTFTFIFIYWVPLCQILVESQALPDSSLLRQQAVIYKPKADRCCLCHVCDVCHHSGLASCRASCPHSSSSSPLSRHKGTRKPVVGCHKRMLVFFLSF